MSNPTLLSATWWLARGVAPIPIRERDKRPAREWQPYQTQLPTLTDLDSWFGNGSRLNVGIVCGWEKMVTLDYDSRDSWRDWREWIEANRPNAAEVMNTRQSDTARGKHLYIKVMTPVRTRPIRSLGIDVKAAGGYVLVPPSIHPTGVPYTLVDPDARILSCECLSDVLPPEALVDAVRADPPSGVVVPPPPAVLVTDPWAVAEAARDFDQAQGLARIKAAYRIEDFVQGTRASSRDSRWLMGLCPLHDDHNPSFWIDTSRQLCGCHAGCTTKPMDYIDLFGRVCNISNEDAIRYLSRSLDGG